MTAFNWCVALTHPFSEMVAEASIREHGLQPFNPKCQVRRVIRHRVQITIAPYFAGYVFANLDLDDPSWGALLRCRGVRDLLWSQPGKPSRVRAPMMQVLIDKCGGGDIVEDAVIDTALSRIIPRGAMVDVPSLDTRGKVTWTKGDRVRVLMSFLGTDREVTMKTSQVELVQ